MRRQESTMSAISLFRDQKQSTGEVGVKRILEYAAAREKQAVFHTGNPKSKSRASDAFFFLQK